VNLAVNNLLSRDDEGDDDGDGCDPYMSGNLSSLFHFDILSFVILLCGLRSIVE